MHSSLNNVSTTENLMHLYGFPFLNIHFSNQIKFIFNCVFLTDIDIGKQLTNGFNHLRMLQLL